MPSACGGRGPDDHPSTVAEIRSHVGHGACRLRAGFVPGSSRAGRGRQLARARARAYARPGAPPPTRVRRQVPERDSGGQPTAEEQLRALYENAESTAARAFEQAVGTPSFGALLARSAENAAALTRIGSDLADLVLRNLRLAGRADITRLARQLHRTEDKLERVLQEIEQLRDELAAREAPDTAREAPTTARGGPTTARGRRSVTGRATSGNGRAAGGTGTGRSAGGTGTGRTAGGTGTGRAAGGTRGGADSGGSAGGTRAGGGSTGSRTA